MNLSLRYLTYAWTAGLIFSQSLCVAMVDKNDASEKLQQQIVFLTTALQKDPNNPHHLFHLAQTYSSLKNYEEALTWYQNRIEKDELDEEKWFSTYMLGECYEGLDQWEQAFHWYLAAYQIRPDRAEPLKKIATYYRLHGQNELAYIFAKHGSRIPYPTNQLLLSTPPLYDYQFDEELSITSYYTRFKDEGYLAASDLMLSKTAPWYIKEQSSKNILFYVQNLPQAYFQPITIELPRIYQGLDEFYKPMNPSISKTNDGYRMILRAVNYTQIGAKIFNTIDPSGVFRTKNFLVHYDRELNLVSHKEIIETLPRERIRSFNIDGMEDCRIFELNKQFWFTCTTTDTNPAGAHQISLCQLSAADSTPHVPVEKLVPLNGPDPYRCEKNWLPFINKGELHVIYSYDPFIIYKPHLTTGQCETILNDQPNYDFSRFRGSAAPIEFDAGYLMLVHEVAYLPDSYRCYTHRFLYLDPKFRVQKLSKPFIFKHQGIEFCCSMTLDHTGTQLIMPIGIEDREAWLCFINLETIRSLLNPLPPYVKPPAELS